MVNYCNQELRFLGLAKSIYQLLLGLDFAKNSEGKCSFNRTCQGWSFCTIFFCNYITFSSLHLKNRKLYTRTVNYLLPRLVLEKAFQCF